MKTLNIGFDVDGVLRELFPHATNIFLKAHPHYNKHFKQFKQLTSYDTINWLKNPDENINKEFRNYIFRNNSCSHIYTTAPIYPDAINFNDLITKLKSELWAMNIKSNVYIITAQRVLEQIVSTISWLKDHNITNYDSLIITDNKGTFGLNYIVEDSVDNCRVVKQSGGVPILRLQPYNKHFDEEFAYCTTSLPQSINCIIDIEREKL